jgi:hypothetical protein
LVPQFPHPHHSFIFLHHVWYFLHFHSTQIIIMRDKMDFNCLWVLLFAVIPISLSLLHSPHLSFLHSQACYSCLLFTRRLPFAMEEIIGVEHKKRFIEPIFLLSTHSLDSTDGFRWAHHKVYVISSAIFTLLSFEIFFFKKKFFFLLSIFILNLSLEELSSSLN